MALNELSFGRDWTNPEDFPVYEESEQKVREDYQYHPNQIRDYLNTEIVGALNGRLGAANVGVSDGKTVQDSLDKLTGDVQTLAGGTVPEQGSTLGWDLDAGGNKVANLGAPTADGDAVPLGYAINDALRTQFGLGEGASLADLLAWAQPGEYQWARIATLSSPGSGTFTAPDLFDGEDYELGYYMIGGGGSGGAAVRTFSTSNRYGAAAGGGASGLGVSGVLTVSPGAALPWVVGAGGAAVAAAITTGDYAGTAGLAGGDTSFNGDTAEGGGGGRCAAMAALYGSGTSAPTLPTVDVGSSGGQASDDVSGCRYLPARFGGTPPVDVTPELATQGSATVSGQTGAVPTYTFNGTAGKSFQPGRTGQNPFDPLMVTLGCGGYAAVASLEESYSVLPPNT